MPYISKTQKMLSHKRIVFLAFFLIIGAKTNAQYGLIKGWVTDEETKAPLPGASVNLSSSGVIDNTDPFGGFLIRNIPAGSYEVVISHVGYKTEVIRTDVKEDVPVTLSVSMRKTRLDLASVTVAGKKAQPLSAISAIDIKLRPVNNSQDVLRIVPGLFIAQHAGGGKAEQIFLRGFDIDHGTDIGIRVDGMPVNMVSHAHGQGYADLHFLIPETVEKVSFDKGPYSPAAGNLATAGYVDFQTKDYLGENILKAEAGSFSTRRTTALVKLFNKEKEDNRQQVYIASEYFLSNGYVESPQHFGRLNMMAKYSASLRNNTRLSIIASAFDSKWNASGQVPQRAVDQGIITRLGAIDNREGGNTSRYNFSASFAKQWKNNWKTTDQLYFSRYFFNLYSNFTFFLDDPVDGDMINQREKRSVLGYTTTAAKSWLLGNKIANTAFGGGFRYDDVQDIQLAKTPSRVFRSYIQRGDVKETNGFLYWNQQLDLSDRWQLNGGLRYDLFRFGYRDVLQNETRFSYQQRGVLSPKLNFSYTANKQLKFFLNNGIGFHSNDTRVILDRGARDILPRVYGSDLGLIAKPLSQLVIKTAVWHLFSEQEFVYVGDAGIVEPGGKTRRMGLDFSLRCQLRPWLYADADLNLTRARTVAAIKGEDYVPLAPSFTSMGGITVKTKNGFNASLRYRYFGDRPANEDRSVMAEGYWLADAVISYQWKKWELQFSAENLMNIKWKEAQFDTESRLFAEPAPVSEIHFTPGTPRFLKAGISFHF